MGSATTDLGKSYLATFLRRLEQLGWAGGRNARIETRRWTGTVDEYASRCCGTRCILARRDHGVGPLLIGFAGACPCLAAVMGNKEEDGL
jgi:hypothetical protein